MSSDYRTPPGYYPPVWRRGSSNTWAAGPPGLLPKSSTADTSEGTYGGFRRYPGPGRIFVARPFLFCLPCPRGGHRSARRFLEYDFLKVSSRSEPWEAHSWRKYRRRGSEYVSFPRATLRFGCMAPAIHGPGQRSKRGHQVKYQNSARRVFFACSHFAVFLSWVRTQTKKH